MADKPKTLKPRLPRGLADREAADIRAIDAMVDKIAAVFERYGFDPVDTPLIEYTETLGKFLPDTDRPNEGVFSFQDEDESWLSLRYDLTAPLARYFAENYQKLPKPYRSYRAGWVFRNEKPGPGRFRQFMQLDADTVGSSSPAADAEMAMMMADVLEGLGLARGSYLVKFSNRKIFDGLLDSMGFDQIVDAGRRLKVLRAIDKFDRLGVEGVRQLLDRGRKDESGDFTSGAELGEAGAQIVVEFLTGESIHNPSAEIAPQDNPALTNMKGGIGIQVPPTLVRNKLDLQNPTFLSGMDEANQIKLIVEGAGYGPDRIRFEPSVVRGLEYYTGPVFEAELTFPVTNEKGQQVVFGSVAGGGRYDGLVSRFRSEPVPATGFSIGVSRLAEALRLTGNLKTETAAGPVVVLVMDRDRMGDYQQMVAELRNAGIRAEMFLGNPKNFGKQLAYADQRNSPAAIIEG
ncbi:MAG: histidine--tRNA ligase, partial [Cucumibacter sp.]